MKRITLFFWGLLMMSLAVPAGAGQALSGPDKMSLGSFAYAEVIENPGSKSAGARGVLTFNGAPLRGYDGRQLRTPIGSFYYIDSQYLWETRGWFPMADIPIEAVDEMIDIDDLHTGFYEGALRVGTPKDWCYDPGGDTWYDPERLMPKPAGDQ